MDFKIAVLAGDGIGPEISVQGVDVMTAVCEKFGHKVSYEYAICGADAIDKVGDPFPEETYQVCKQADEEVHFYKISEINKEKDKINIEKGKRVRVHGGPFDQVEGYFIKVAKKRGRQLVVIIPDLLAVSAEVKPEYIQIID